MGCGESKHAVATANATIPKNKRSLSSKSESRKGENIVKTENGEKMEEEKELIAPKMVAVEKEKEEEVVEPKNETIPVAVVETKKNENDEATTPVSVVEKENTTPVAVVEKKNENEEMAPVSVVEKKNAIDETIPVPAVEKKNENEETASPVSVVAVVEKKESVEEIKAEEKTGLFFFSFLCFYILVVLHYESLSKTTCLHKIGLSIKILKIFYFQIYNKGKTKGFYISIRYFELFI